MHTVLSPFVVSAVALVCGADFRIEPVCSKFDYEEKLFAKTMRLENTMDTLVSRVTNIETTLKHLEERFDTQLQAAKDEIQQTNG